MMNAMMRLEPIAEIIGRISIDLKILSAALGDYGMSSKLTPRDWEIVDDTMTEVFTDGVHLVIGHLGCLDVETLSLVHDETGERILVQNDKAIDGNVCTDQPNTLAILGRFAEA